MEERARMPFDAGVVHTIFSTIAGENPEGITSVPSLNLYNVMGYSVLLGSGAILMSGYHPHLYADKLIEQIAANLVRDFSGVELSSRRLSPFHERYEEVYVRDTLLFVPEDGKNPRVISLSPKSEVYDAPLELIVHFRTPTPEVLSSLMQYGSARYGHRYKPVTEMLNHVPHIALHSEIRKSTEIYRQILSHLHQHGILRIS